MIFKNMFEIII